jgi:hypothetical protein
MAQRWQWFRRADADLDRLFPALPTHHRDLGFLS